MGGVVILSVTAIGDAVPLTMTALGSAAFLTAWPAGKYKFGRVLGSFPSLCCVLVVAVAFVVSVA